LAMGVQSSVIESLALLLLLLLLLRFTGAH
jgi:hypothetical protein